MLHKIALWTKKMCESRIRGFTPAQPKEGFKPPEPPKILFVCGGSVNVVPTLTTLVGAILHKFSKEYSKERFEELYLCRWENTNYEVKPMKRQEAFWDIHPDLG